MGAALLAIGGVWGILDDTYFRRPWKGYQHEFSALEKQKEVAKLEKEESVLDQKAEVQELRKNLDVARTALDLPETRAKRSAVEARLAEARLDEGGADLQVRFVKSELEASKYQYDHALESGGDVPAARARRDGLEQLKVEREAA